MEVRHQNTLSYFHSQRDYAKARLEFMNCGLKVRVGLTLDQYARGSH